MNHALNRSIRVALVMILTTTRAGAAQSIPYDSGGIKVFDYRTTVPAAAFTVADTATVRFMGNPQDSTDVLGVTAMLRLRDGRIAIGISQSAVTPGVNDGFRHFAIDVRLYNPAGSFLAKLGSFGGGPNMFGSNITLIREQQNGHLFIVSGVGYRELGTDGREYSRAMPEDALGHVVGALSDRSFVVTRRVPPYPSFPEVIVRYWRMWQDMSGFVRASTEGRQVVQLPLTTVSYYFTNLPDYEYFSNIAPWPVRVLSPLLAENNAIWKFDGVLWELHVLDADAHIRAIVRPPIPPLLQNARLGAGMPIDNLYDVASFLDNEGRYWMETGTNTKPGPVDASRRTWLVFEPGGRLLGSVLMPAGFRAVNVVGDELLGWERQSVPAPTYAETFRFRK